MEKTKGMEQRHKEKAPVSFRKKAMCLLESGKRSARRLLVPKEKRMALDSALISAVQNGNSAGIIRLIKAGADVTAKDKDGYTAMHSAAAIGRTQACLLLIQEYAKAGGDAKELIAARGIGNRTTLYCAAGVGRTETCLLLIQEYAKAGGDAKWLITAKNDIGWTSLHIAALMGCAETCLLLIQEYAKAGGDAKELITAKDNFSSYALHYAADNGYTETCKLIIKKYAEAGGNLKELIAATNDCGKTALQYAAEKRHTEIARLLSALKEASESMEKFMDKEESRSFILAFVECAGWA